MLKNRRKQLELLLNNHHVITIGTSAGGIEALQTLIGQLPKNFPAAILIVQHLSNEAASNLVKVLDKVSQLPIEFAKDRQLIELSHIYLAPPDFHLVVKGEQMKVIRGPRENRMRPAIDPLFRTAAVSYRSYATGVILTGMLDDGTAGLQAIESCGGMTIVQDPSDAAYSSMPKSAIANVKVDRIAPLKDIPDILIERVKQTPPMVSEIPAELLLEAPITKEAITEPETMKQIGQPVAHSCPSCGGPLWQIGNSAERSSDKSQRFGKDSLLRYRCHIGHAFTSRTLIEEQNEATEKALWIALRTLEERSRLLKNMSDRFAQKGAKTLAETHEERAKEALEHSALIRDLIRALRTVTEFPIEENTNREAS